MWGTPLSASNTKIMFLQTYILVEITKINKFSNKKNISPLQKIKIGWCESDRMSILGWMIRAQEFFGFFFWKINLVQAFECPSASVAWSQAGSALDHSGFRCTCSSARSSRETALPGPNALLRQAGGNLNLRKAWVPSLPPPKAGSSGAMSA